MSFNKLPNNQGMIFVPDCKPGQKRHPCPDCFSCQWCGKERCRVCKGKIKIPRVRTQEDRFIK